MHGLDDSTDLAFLVGRTLLGLRIGRYQLILEFDDAEIGVESRLRVFGDRAAEIDVRAGGTSRISASWSRSLARGSRPRAWEEGA